MMGKYRIIYLLASFVIEIACVYGMYNDSRLRVQRSSSSEGEVKAYNIIVLTLENPSQHISSPGYPDKDYPDATEIIYDIEMKLSDELKQMSSRILLEFEMFKLEESNHCKSDGLEITDFSGYIRVYCGSHEGLTYLSESSKIKIRFYSDPTVESRGFSISVNIYNTDCSQLFKGVSTGTFSTPNFPIQYSREKLCVWKIEVAEGKRILVRFNEIFDLLAQNPLCHNDYLAVSLTGNFSTDKTKYCRNKGPGTVISSENSMLFMFRSDCCDEGKGFSASFFVTDSDGVVLPSPKMFCGCGEENKLEGERIVGGKTVDPPNRYPFVVGLVNNVNEFFCGGALVSRLYVLTAANCLRQKVASDVRIALGAHNTDSSPDPVPVSEFIIHLNFDSTTIYSVDDIALVKLSSPVQLTKTVGLACLPIYPQFVSPVKLGTVSGWGATNSNEKIFPDKLQELQVSIVSNELCYRNTFTPGSSREICTAQVDGKGSCVGDVGAPLFVKYDEKWFTVGVVAWRGSCGVKDHPDSYTRVSEYIGWISNHTQDSPPCRVKKIDPSVKPNLENCGIPNEREEERIAGGYIADPHEFPWIGRITYNHTFAGLGSLISPKYVLTVASIFKTWYHKMKNYPWIVDVFLGRHQISVVEPNFRKFDVEAVFYPGGYDVSKPYKNDLALLKLEQPATGMYYKYRPICLPRADASYSPGLELKTAGWGRISKSGPVSDVLLKADMNVWSIESCRNRYSSWFKNNMICAYKEGTDTCKGDAGAPLMIIFYGRYYLAGLSSWGNKDECATSGDPRVFSAVHSHLDWIHDITGLSVA